MNALPTFDVAWRARQRHQPYFCEENVWQLLAGEELPRPAAALFITNAARSVAMWGQRAAVRDPIVWDYHVVAVLPAHALVVDLDAREHTALPLARWLAHAFLPVADELAPRFRCVPWPQLQATFHSDRSHMRDARGREVQPFPSWPPVGDARLGHTLGRFLDLGDPIAGVVTDAAGLPAALAALAH